MAVYVLDTSAFLAWIQGEPGGDFVASKLTGVCELSSVNFAELVTKLVDVQHQNVQNLGQQLRSLGVAITPFTEAQGITAGLLRQQTRVKGLSLGDRACLALALERQAEVLTADKAWLALGLPLTIVDIRHPDIS